MIRKLLKNRRGASAVEFALVAPILISFYFGVAELGQGTMAITKTSNVASSIGDLAAQNGTLNNAQVADIFKIGGLLMTPFAASSLSMRITSLSADSKGAVTVDWSEPNGTMTALKTGSAQTVPTGLIAANQSIILAEASYGYASPVNYFIPHPITINRKFYLRPRKTDSVTRCATC